MTAQIKVKVQRKAIVRLKMLPRYNVPGATGPAGPTGPVGSPGVVWRGNWSNTTNYFVNDGVANAGNSYVCVIAHTATATPPPTANWNLLAQGGTASIADSQIDPIKLNSDNATEQHLFRDRLNFVARDGDTMTAELTLSSSTPSGILVAASKGYVDTGDAAGITAIGNRAVRYDAAQALTAPQQAQARVNINITKKNYAINGGMQVSQENGTTTLTVSGNYAADMFATFFTAGSYNFAQVASSTPGGSTHRHRITVVSGPGSVGSSDLFFVRTGIEGFRVSDLLAGTAQAKTITLRFGVKAPAGTYPIQFGNGANDRSYVTSFTIAGGEANTDVVKTITLQLDQSGTWTKNNTVGLYIRWGLYMGSTYQTTANTWTAGLYYAPTGVSNNIANSSVFELFDVALHEGSVAPDYQLPDLPNELQLCKRYWQSMLIGWLGQSTNGTNHGGNYQYQTEMRTTPTIALVTAIQEVNFPATAASFQQTGTAATNAYKAATATGGAIWTDTYSLTARL
jgi:hypothetical protein